MDLSTCRGTRSGMGHRNDSPKPEQTPTDCFGTTIPSRPRPEPSTRLKVESEVDIVVATILVHLASFAFIISVCPHMTV